MSRFFVDNLIILLLRKGWQYAGNLRPLLVLCLGMFVVAQAIMLAEPYVIGRLLNSVQAVASKATTVKHMWSDVTLNLWLIFWIQFVFWLFHGPARVLERYAAYHIKANYKQYLFDAIAQLPLQWHRQHHSGESIDKINRATNALGTFFDYTFEITYMLTRLLGSLVVLFLFMPYSGLIAMIATAVAFASVYVFDHFLTKQYDQLNSLDNRVAAAVHDYVSNIATVITLRLEERVGKEVMARMLAPLALFKRNIFLNETKWGITSMLIASMTVAVLFHYTYGELNAGHTILAGTFFTLFQYLRMIGDSFYDFTDLYGRVVKNAADVESAESINRAFLDMNQSHVASLPAGWTTVEVNDLCFKYHDEKHREHHLQNVKIKLERGKRIALVGESGCGKSTLLLLLRGLQDADSVTMRCDGQLMAHGLKHLASHTTLIPQDPEIFSDTIGFNITFGMPATSNEIDSATRLSRFDQVLTRLPRQLETNIAEKGVNLSGGEKQRLALARGVFLSRDSDILLLDEPTSSVDSLNERIIYANILAQSKDRCVVSSIHKLHLLELFDEIYVFGHGLLLEQGSLPSLLSRGGELSTLWSNYQSEADRGAAEHSGLVEVAAT